MIKKSVLLNPRSLGFTLIELVVVFSVIIIVSTLGIASNVSYSRAQTLQQASNEFVTVLNTAKARSGSQIKPTSQCTAVSALNGYSVTVNIAARSYALNVICSGVTTPLSTTTLPNGVSFNSATGNPATTTTSVTFSVLTGGVIGSGNIVLSAFGSSKTVTISQVGGIQ